jgi:glycosyltransferase involved in cell wall biosynthesis
MKVYYISPSTIPSRSANSIHVVNMCEGLNQLGYEVVLFAHSNSCNSLNCQKQLKNIYGVDNRKINLKIFRSKKNRGVEFIIALRALIFFILDLIKNTEPKYIISRNLYAATFLGLFFRRNVIYETHSPERGFRKNIQKWLLDSKNIQTVVISEALKIAIKNLHSVNGKNLWVFHDAARAGKSRLNNSQRQNLRNRLLNPVVDLSCYDKIIGYFGHLYSGRGIEVIQGAALKNPRHVFVVYGGNEKEIIRCRENNSVNNLFFMGYISPKLIYSAMGMMDILLMPYQKSVSIGLVGVDTAKWMSPMKLFEYLSTGVPIISSDLSVLREVLIDGDNCILVKASNIEDWSNAIQKIISDSDLENKLGINSYNLYINQYNWMHRAECMLNLGNSNAI